MIIILLTRVQSPEQEGLLLPSLTLKRHGDSLEINGELYDFSVLAPGDLLPDGFAATQCPHLTGQIERDETGKLHITLLLPCGFDAPESARFPQPIIDPPDGDIELPDTHWPPSEPPAPPMPQQEQLDAD